MADWDSSDVIFVAPEFAAPFDDTIIDGWIALVDNLISPDAFGSRTVMAGSLLTAHYLTLFGGLASAPGLKGDVKSITVGPVSTSYGTVTGEAGRIYSGALGRTRYGIQFAGLVEVSALTPTVL